MTWSQIKSIENASNEIIITRRNGNAFLIPARAFQSEVELTDFLAKINSWKAASSN
jgi:hypothetical protein